MITAALLSVTLGAEPSSPPDLRPRDDFADRLAKAEILANGNEIQIVGYDHAGSPIAVLALWVDEHGARHLESDYDDGYASVIIANGREHTESTLPAEVLGVRANLLIERVPLGPQESWFTCGASAALAVAGCHPATAGPAIWLTCPGTLAFAICECAPELDIEVHACN
jgi:hypothetical protein